jgi:hypothetical protein
MAVTRMNSTIFVLMTHKLCTLLGALSDEIGIHVYNCITKSVGRNSVVVNIGPTCGQRPIPVAMRSKV